MPKDRKKCPLGQYGGDCCKEECAWWDDLAKDCAMLVIAKLGGEGSFYGQRQEQKESIERARGIK